MSKNYIEMFKRLSVNGQEFLLNDARQDVELSDKYSLSYQRTIVKWTFSYMSFDVPGETLVISGSGDSVLAALEKLKQ
ncbi:hypothetical phage protein [Escherichia phage phiEcoM-GJ1]|uniref:Hypothetical phage protein n=1 Tax=Escherichia phage phiEcoM-GJ1 TaxID=451705 RepID=A9Q1R6_9CAUD|nr:hypothetical protein phiEcoMGJ1_gp13 [Escherichia phage phiEcoM-GJ1]ABR68725.1 hypothetical phage protein [Escherichia phage phiEcoM-GJ1]